MNISTEIDNSQYSSAEDQYLIYIINTKKIDKTIIIKTFLFKINILERTDEVLLIVPIKIITTYISNIILYKTISLKIK
jgi:hypothetical protein